MTIYLVALTFGLVAAGFGGELFVRGSVGLANRLRIPSGIVGATVAAFATSSPEASVAVNAALANSTSIALGDALGSNVVNIGLILGVALIFKSIKVSLETLRRDFSVALLAPFLTLFLVLDGFLARTDAFVLLALFLGWLGLIVRDALKTRTETEVRELGSLKWGELALQNIGGVLLLILAGKFIVFSAKGFTEIYGLDPFVVGATLVAVGTSIPELATVIISRVRGHDEVGIGAVLGSNIFNNLFIVSVATLIQPFAVKWSEVSIGLAFGIVLVLSILPGRAQILTPFRGGLLMAVYVLYVSSFLLF